MDGLLSSKSEALAESIKDISFKCKMEMENFISTEQYFERKADVKKYTFVYNGKKENKKTLNFMITLIIEKSTVFNGKMALYHTKLHCPQTKSTW